MSLDTNWDVNKYMDKTEYELHWEMRKSFMEAHKNKYPEDRLVTLSKVFANMEFMGCIYNSELMVLVKNLAKQVDDIVEYRKDKAKKISRTFVKASDAVKKNINPPKLPANNNNKRNNKRKPQLVEFDELDDSNFERKRFKQENSDDPIRKIANEEDWKLFQKARSQPGIKGKFIIHDTKVSDLQGTISGSAAKAKAKLEYCTTPHATKENLKIHQLKIDEEIVAHIESEENLNAGMKNKLSAKAIKELKKYCFTISPTNNVETVGKQFKAKPIKSAVSNSLQNGIGAKIMKLMGWKGEGLGKNSTGIQEPIEAATLQVHKEGLGMEKTGEPFNKAMKTYLYNYLKSDEKRPLQFSSSFSKKQRATIHSIVQKMQLKSKSSGRGRDRQIKVEKKISGWKLIEDLLANGGFSEAYTLKKPTALS